MAKKLNKKGVEYSEPFYLTSVCLEDLENQGYDVSSIDKETMQHLAKKMGESIMNEFWNDMDIIAEELDIKEK